jgi:uncharacterized protein YbaR (Trm112 family)
VHNATLELLRCPYCGGRLDLVTSLYHRRDGDEIEDGILGCHCCIFPIVSGIPILHLQPAATIARDQIQAAQPDLARRTMFGLSDERDAAAFEAVATSGTATYRDLVEALGPSFEGGYFLYRFSDPTYVVADAVVRAVAGTVLDRGGRAVDICGGSGHLTRSLTGLSSSAPVLADLYFAKVWLARRFTAPGCEGVCCDGNSPMPFARGAFRFAMCADAFMYIWTKRQFVGELARLVDPTTGAVLIGHTHNERTWCPSHGQPLSPEGYADLFETMEPRIFAEAGLFSDVVDHGALDLSRRDAAEALDRDPALTIIATRHPGVFERHRVEADTVATGEFRLNPLYVAAGTSGDAGGAGGAGDPARLRLTFPDDDYAQEYGACRRYLPDEISLDWASLGALPAATVTGPLAALAARRVILDLPKRYY